MGRTVQISNERYDILRSLAAERGQTPEEVLDTLLDEAWEQECARYDATFHTDPGWQEAAHEAAAGERAPGQVFPSTEAFFRHLGADEDDLDAARRLDADTSTD